MPEEVLGIDDIIESERPQALLLGNGFSIAGNALFAYSELRQAIELTPTERQDRIARIFEHWETYDFEVVLDKIETARTVAMFYKPLRASWMLSMAEDLRALRNAFGSALVQVHPARPGDVNGYGTAKDLLSRFDCVFTVNYDLLLYWAMRRHPPVDLDDGFRGEPPLPLTWRPTQHQQVYWLHGAIHLSDVEIEGAVTTTKRRWGGINEPIISQVQTDIELGSYPLVILEGSWEKKLERIHRSPYLYNGYQRLRSLAGSLTTFGWRMGSQDKHIVDAIAASKLSEIAIGLYGPKSDPANSETIAAASALAARRDNLTVRYWDVSTADVWRFDPFDTE